MTKIGSLKRPKIGEYFEQEFQNLTMGHPKLIHI